MLRSLNTGVSGIRQFQTSLDAIGNNLANVNTVGYKAARVEFSDTLNQTLRAGTPDTTARSGSGAVQVGNGVEVSGIKNLFSQGAVNQTGNSTDLAVSGEGFFIVRSANGEAFATRAGDFHVDSAGNLVTNQGLRVQGFDTTEPAGGYTAASTVGDIKLDKGTAPAGVAAAAFAAAEIQNINIDSAGKINILLSDGTQYVRGQILLQKFTNPNALLRQGNNLYSGLSTAGAATQFGIATAATTTDATFINSRADQKGFGRINSGSLEISNVDLSREFSTLITTQRAFQANARVITASDDILQEMIRIVR
jgi:flagellar hook protein FlgE